MLKLTRPLCYLDIESATTKGRPDAAVDRIISLSMTKVHPDGSRSQSDLFFNPGINITPENAAIHGFTNEGVATFTSLNPGAARGIQLFLAGCDLAGYNLLNYDVPLLWESLYRHDVELNLDGVHIVDVANIFKKKEERSLTAALKFYCGKEHSGAHGAAADVQATMEVLDAQVRGFKHNPVSSDSQFADDAGRHYLDEGYADLGKMTIAELAAYSKMDQRADLFGTIVLNEAGEPVFNTKRNQGVRVVDDPGYAHWMLRNDFPANTRRVIEKILHADANPLF